MPLCLPSSSLPTAGRVRPGRRGAFAAGLALASAAWAGAAGWYVLTKDDLAVRVFARQAEMRYAYEDRIGDLQRRLEREVTGGLVERTGHERRADALLARQLDIEARQAWLRGLMERAAEPGSRPFGPPALTPQNPPAGETAPKPTPLPDAAMSLRPGSAAAPVSPAASRFSDLDARLDRVAAEEASLLSRLRGDVQARTARYRTALAATGLPPARLAAGPEEAVGGPLVPWTQTSRSHPLAAVSAEVEARVADLARLRAAVRTLPLASPVAAEAEPTSGFGYRVDPFTRGLALHTGLDLRAEAGTPVRATAPGRVVEADLAGGYGNMVELDHGGGLSTRYGHLSGFAVTVGDVVQAGQVIGRAGATGRSTGPHLHYETRIAGEPVNPIRFLQAGRMLLADDER